MGLAVRPELDRQPLWAKVIDQTRCIGCHACTTACKSENEVPLSVTRTYVKYVDLGVFPNARRAFQVTRCNQCDDPPCVAACPTAAMHQRRDGIVDFDKSICIGCKACIAACPYDAIFTNPEDIPHYHQQMEAAMEGLAKSEKILPTADFEALSKQIAAKQTEHEEKIKAIGSAPLKKFAKQAGVKWYQWANTGELQAQLMASTPEEVHEAQLSVFKKYKGWVLKHGSAKVQAELPAIEKALKAKKPLHGAPKTSTPPPAAQPVPPSPKPKKKKTAKPKPAASPTLSPTTPPAPKKTLAFTETDEAWKKNPPKLTFVKDATDLGGAHTKFIYSDEQGREWLFKPVSEDFRAHGDEVAYKIGRLIDPNAVEVRVIELPGPHGKRLGSVQQFVPNLRPKPHKDFSHTNRSEERRVGKECRSRWSPYH